MNKSLQAFAIYFQGPVQLVPLEEALLHQDTSRMLWIHMDAQSAEEEGWLSQLGIDPIIMEALTTPSSRARYIDFDDSLFISFNQINNLLDHEQTPSVRVFLTANRVVSVNVGPCPAVELLLKEIHYPNAPRTVADFVIHLMRMTNSFSEPHLERLDLALDVLEKKPDRSTDRELTVELGDIRSDAIIIRRLLIPQRDALIQLHNTTVKWFSRTHHRKIREDLERLQLFIETLDLIKERANIIMDENRIALAQSSNQGMYLFSLVAVLFLPISALTSLFGVNLGGIPGASSPYSFWIFSITLLVIQVALVLCFRRWRLF